MERFDGLSASVLDAALDYHRRGFAPLPLRGKQPATDLIRKAQAALVPLPVNAHADALLALGEALAEMLDQLRV